MSVESLTPPDEHFMRSHKFLAVLSVGLAIGGCVGASDKNTSSCDKVTVLQVGTDQIIDGVPVHYGNTPNFSGGTAAYIQLGAPFDETMVVPRGSERMIDGHGHALGFEVGKDGSDLIVYKCDIN